MLLNDFFIYCFEYC